MLTHWSSISTREMKQTKQQKRQINILPLNTILNISSYLVCFYRVLNVGVRRNSWNLHTRGEGQAIERVLYESYNSPWITKKKKRKKETSLGKETVGFYFYKLKSPSRIPFFLFELRILYVNWLSVQRETDIF